MLTGRRALITGSTGGIGLAIATALAQSGCAVMLNGLEPPDEVAAKIGDGVGQYCQADVSREEGVAALVAATRAALGGIDILVNNAVVRSFAPVEKMATAQWQHALAVNITAPFHAIQQVLPDMRAAGFGRIVNMGSVYSSRGAAGRVDYVTTKAAVLGLTRAVAMETLHDGITCNVVCPGAVCTPASDQRIRAAMAAKNQTRAQAEQEFLIGKGPAERFVPAEDIAALVVFLCAPAAGNITGAMLPVDGGWLAS